jgi:hypothetical protein
MTADEINAEIIQQISHLRARGLDPAFIVLDRISYLVMDHWVRATLKDAFGVLPESRLTKLVSVGVVVVGDGLTITVVAAPHIEAIR